MAWTTSDLVTIDAAISNGLAEVRYPDGRTVRYNSVSDQLKARDVIKNYLVSVSGIPQTRTYRAYTSKGFED